VLAGALAGGLDLAIVETRVGVWEALAGRAPGQPVGPADPGLWSAVAERINPAKARPVLRAGIEKSGLVSARGVAYTMLRSPDGARACYLRLAPEEVELARLMDGSRTLARLVAEFARISGRLAPDQVRRVVADLAGNRMLEELPVDAFARLARVRRRPWPLRLGRGMLAFAQGRRMVVANVDALVTVLYRAGGRVLFTRVAAAVLGAVAVVGLVAFGWQWWTGAQSVFLTGNSYAAGAAVLLGLNVVALACHELGHALAAKHAGRRVPAAGFLVYFGIPSVFVDTTDVWMTGRRGRLRTTAAGPVAGLVLAGGCALVGLAVPAAAPWCFKLSFAWYLNALFNLNPFLALDGYYLLMDWLEVPNLRARGLSWVAARVRRRPPAWPALDREGRLVALYGLLAVGWLAVAANIGYRVYADRVGGLITGLWRSGWPARLLLAAVVAALASPLVYVGCGWLARRWRHGRRWLAERRVERDAPRRLDALRASSLRDLPAEALVALAATARWVHPRPGQQLVVAGAAQPDVFAVVDGALEGRVPGDPAGTVRQRVGAGGVVGLAPALAGAPSPLSWYTAGTTLLAVPSTDVAATLGPVAGGLATTAGKGLGTVAEAETLFAESPALSGLSQEDRLGLASVAQPVLLAPGERVTLAGADDAVVLASGVIATPDGQSLGRGTVIGPAGVVHPSPVAVTRTPVRLFRVPAVSGLALLLGTSVSTLAAEADGRAPGRPPITGAHPVMAYPPLAVPPGPPVPPPQGAPSYAAIPNDVVDRRFERRLRWLLILVLLLALLLTGGNILLAPLTWAEMPTDKALLRVAHGGATAVVATTAYHLDEGDQIYLGAGDHASVDPTSRAQLTYRGGASTILCAGTDITMGPLETTGSVPHADLTLHAGRALTDTATPSPAFDDLDAALTLPGGVATNQGPAWYAASPFGIDVSAGKITYAGALVEGDGNPIGCGDGTAIRRPSSTPTSTPTPAATPTQAPTATPSASATAAAAPTTRTSTRTLTSTTTGPVVPPPPPPPTRPPPPPTSPPPPPNNPPTITNFRAEPSTIYSDSCLYDAQSGFIAGTVQDDHTPQQQLRVQFNYTLDGLTYGPISMSWDGDYYGDFDPVFTGIYPQSYTVTLRMWAYDAEGLRSSTMQTSITMSTICTPVVPR
jgi:putative peptide zinc metalloprotease protein